MGTCCSETVLPQSQPTANLQMSEAVPVTLELLLESSTEEGSLVKGRGYIIVELDKEKQRFEEVGVDGVFIQR